MSFPFTKKCTVARHVLEIMATKIILKNERNKTLYHLHTNDGHRLIKLRTLPQDTQVLNSVGVEGRHLSEDILNLSETFHNQKP
jgi:hypothetical protein